MTYPGWDRLLCEVFGWPQRAPQFAFLNAWARCEGGGAKYNPLNTTLRLPGSTNYNRVGVQHYIDSAQGHAATVLTLRLPAYSPLRHAMQRSDLKAPGILALSEKALATWGTGSECIARILKGS